MRTQFKALAVGQLFIYNGNVHLKMSSRTSKLVQYGRTFYIDQNATVEVAD